MGKSTQQVTDEAIARLQAAEAALARRKNDGNGSGHDRRPIFGGHEFRRDHSNNIESQHSPVRIVATPHVWEDPSAISPRRWLFGKHYVRKFVTATIAPGGLGKSSLALVEVISMATGRNLLGEPQAKGPLRAWYWNGEDPLEEIRRRIAAICKYYKIGARDLGGRLFRDSGRESKIIVATKLQEHVIVAVPVVDALKQELREKRVDCLILDPFIRTHGVSENDNSAIEQVATVFAEIADEVDCAIDLVHHTRKPPPGGDGERTVDDGRGAGSLIAKTRSVRVLNVMTKTEANDVGIEPNKRSLHFRIDNGKANMQPPAETAKWRKLVSVPLDNATADDPEDWVQVATQWEMPGALEGVTSAHLSQVIATVRADGEYRADPRAAKWIGKLVANVIGADLKEPIGERKVKRALKAWFQSKALAEREGKDASRRTVAFVEVGPGWEDESGPAQV